MIRPWAMVIGAGVGAVAGLAAYEWAPAAELHAVVTYATDPIGRIFLRLLFMLAIPIVFSALILGVAGLDLGGLGRIGLKTLAYTILISACAVGIGLGLVNLVEPGGGDNTEVRQMAHDLAEARARAGHELPEAPPTSGVDMVVNMVPDNPVAAAASGDMLGVIIFGVILGLGFLLVKTPASERFLEMIQGLYDVSMALIGAILRFAPLGVGALLFTAMATLGWSVLAAIALYAAVVIGGLALHGVVVYSLALALVARRSPRRFLAGAWPALATAFATSSSSATLPTTLRVAEENLGLSRGVSRFVLTAGASMNQNGTALFEGVTVLFLAQLFGVDLSVAQQALVMIICILGGVGTAGVPSGSLPAIAMILAMFDIPPEGLALILGVDRILDMCRTVLNVGGDLVIAAMVDRKE
ncbi:MAG TPA: dicarboxylate/amino acid:cation symporter [Kofleriaceae bacterium]|nr:dicarboxylate/amino acid:cation symporter [Kofleriaceae bacterium]